MWSFEYYENEELCYIIPRSPQDNATLTSPLTPSGIFDLLRRQVLEPVRDPNVWDRSGVYPAGMGRLEWPGGQLQVLQLQAVRERQGGGARG